MSARSRRAATSAALAAALAAVGACGARTDLLLGGSASTAPDGATPEGDGAIVPVDAGADEGVDASGVTPCEGSVPFSDAGPFVACGIGMRTKSLGCWTESEYCVLAFGGPPPGFASSRCDPLPCDCEGHTTCACIDASARDGCSCHDDGGVVTVTCEVP